MSKYAKIWDSKQDLVSEQDKNTPWFKIMRWMPDKPKVLDVGCSSGYFGEKLMNTKQAEVWGLELDPSDAKLARKRGYKQVLEGDLDSFDWSQLAGLSFDAIIFADVLEHIKDPTGCLQAAQKFLKPGGAIYCSIPNVANMTIRSELMEGNFDYESTGLLDNTHIRFFTKKTLYKTFVDAGLQITNLDATTNEYSDGHITSRLAKIGLEPTAAFDKVLASTEARTFQFIVQAKRSKSKPKLPAEYSVPSKLHDDWPKIAKKMSDDDAEIQRLRADNERLTNRLQEIESRLSHIRRHPVRWVAKGVARKASRGRQKNS